MMNISKSYPVLPSVRFHARGTSLESFLRAIGLFIVFFVVFFQLEAHAQTAPPILPQSKPTLDDRHFQFGRDRQEEEIFKLPEVIEPDDNASLSEQFKVFVKGYRFEGNSIFSNEELDFLALEYKNREVSSLDLEALRRKITLHYVQSGHINSGALLPDQKVSNNIITYQIIEGTLDSITISGNDKTVTRLISSSIYPTEHEILNINTLSERLKLLKQKPYIDNVNARLEAGSEKGVAHLNLQVKEGRPYQLTTTFDNYRPPAVGSISGKLEFTHSNLTGYGDELVTRYEETEGLNNIFLSYKRPLLNYPFSYYMSFENSQSSVIEEPFDLIDIESEFKSLSTGVEYTHKQSLAESLKFSAGIDTSASKSFLLEMPFSFSPGEVNGESNVSAVRFTTDWIRQKLDSVISIRSVMSVGIGAFQATKHDTLPDSSFTSWLGQFQYARRINDTGLQGIVSINTQLTSDALLPMEKFSIGGHSTVRGYRENEFIKDNGFNVSYELRKPLVVNDTTYQNIQLSAFLDYGRAWNTNEKKAEEIYSMGAGLLWNHNEKATAELYLAIPLKSVESSSDEHDLQDSGIHFKLSYHFF